MTARTLIAAAFPLVAALVPATAADAPPAGPLREATVRAVFRLATGQPDLEDEAIGLSLDANRVWTCIWSRDGDGEVVVLQVRDHDGAWRQPSITDISSLQFGIRLDLREKVGKLVEAGRTR